VPSQLRLAARSVMTAGDRMHRMGRMTALD
jgi:hypothetical protein